MTMAQKIWLLVVYVYFTTMVLCLTQSTRRSKIERLENYVRDEIYFLYKRLEATESANDLYVRRLNDTLEQSENLHAELKRYINGDKPELTSELSVSKVEEKIQQLSEQLKLILVGISREKEIRIENTTTIMTKIKEIENFLQIVLTNSSTIKYDVSKINSSCQTLKTGHEDFEERIDLLKNEAEKHTSAVDALRNLLCTSIDNCPDSCFKAAGKCFNYDRLSQFGIDCSEDKGGPEKIIFTVVPESRQLLRGISHNEECQAKLLKGCTEITYTWTFNGETINQFDKSKGFGGLPGGILHIESFNENFEGNYSCIASSDNGTRAEMSFTYDLIESCPAVLEIGPRDAEKKVGDNALLECYAPTATSVTWKKDGRLIDFGHHPRFKKLVNNYLQITNLETQDGGTYRCEARTHTGCYSFKEGALSVIDIQSISEYCGRMLTDEAVSSKISMGRNTRSGEYPWHVTFRAVDKDNGAETTFAGGALISQRWVLTAASVITMFKQVVGHDFGPETVKFYLGTLDCSGVLGKVRKPSNILIHEHFNKTSLLDSDIALVELDSPVDASSTITPVCIESATFNNNMFFGGRQKVVYGKVVGCGRDHRNRPSTKLKAISLPYVNQSDCEEMFENIPNSKITDTVFCAGSKERRYGDVCGGDAGESFVMYDGNRWVQTGIVSLGVGCDRGYYDVFTNVGQFYDWIRAYTKFDKEYMTIL